MAIFPVKSGLSTMPQAVMVIEPYRLDDMWVFDDVTVGLKQEPFVEGITEMIDRLTANIADARAGFRLSFSIVPFEGSQAALSWVRADPVEGNWYRTAEGDEGWLSPALMFYFLEAPSKIYVKAESKQGQS
jgi:hypothetical protein